MDVRASRPSSLARRAREVTLCWKDLIFRTGFTGLKKMVSRRAAEERRKNEEEPRNGISEGAAR